MTLLEDACFSVSETSKGRCYAAKGVCALIIPEGVRGYDAVTGATSAMVAVASAYASGGRSLAGYILRAASTCSAHDSIEPYEAALEQLESAGLV